MTVAVLTGVIRDNNGVNFTHYRVVQLYLWICPGTRDQIMTRYYVQAKYLHWVSKLRD